MLIVSEVKSEAFQSPEAVCSEDQLTVLWAGRQRTWSRRSGTDLGAQGSVLDLARSSALKEMEKNISRVRVKASYTGKNCTRGSGEPSPSPCECGQVAISPPAGHG